MKLFEAAYSGKKVLVFGHTGFKGTWLCLWLGKLGAKVSGASIGLPGEPCHFHLAGLASDMDSHTMDIRDAGAVRDLIDEVQPDYVFHLAAQALVRQSYVDPLETFTTNTIGTANILDALRQMKSTCSVVLITSDKCYDNVETYYGYREDDRLGGKDPYSASKAAAEVAINSYRHSFFSDGDSVVRLASTRAGNVIGGGDWAPDRLVPDVVRCWADGTVVNIRRPHATRPWQHVLEPLSGYLLLGSNLWRDEGFHGEAFNFGPPSSDIYPVSDVVGILSEYLPGLKVAIGDVEDDFHEAGLLKLCCDKALNQLGWESILNFSESMQMTADWYRQYYQHDVSSIRETSEAQIDEYLVLAAKRGAAWIS